MPGSVFLSGMMGAGKSSVGRALAERLALPFVDLDALIEARAGESVAELFRTRGEHGFRDIEAAEVEALVADGSRRVVALGGGTVLRASTRRMLLERGTLITLSASVAALEARLDAVERAGRPLLARGEARRILEGIEAQRAAIYAECHATVSTDDRSIDAVVDRVIAELNETAVVVPLLARSYRVRFAPLERAADGMSRAGLAILVTDENVDAHYGARAEAALRSAGCRTVKVVLAPGEAHKNLAAVERIWDAALAAGADRQAKVVALGGGVVGDIAGFAAATLLRGVAFVQVPTSLLAMVDSSVGGKTGVDRPEGKNLVGAFHQPSEVVVDVSTLSTLPARELASGAAEVVKAAWLDGEASVAALEASGEQLLSLDPGVLEAAILRAVRLKARVVAEDELEAGRRASLNLGHTLGHAIEAASGYALSHGACVGLGMLAAFRVAAGLGDADARSHEDRLRALLERLGLPTDLEAHLRPELVGFLAQDKKRAGGEIRFIVPGAPGAFRYEWLSPARALELAGG